MRAAKVRWKLLLACQRFLGQSFSPACDLSLAGSEGETRQLAQPSGPANGCVCVLECVCVQSKHIREDNKWLTKAHDDKARQDVRQESTLEAICHSLLSGDRTQVLLPLLWQPPPCVGKNMSMNTLPTGAIRIECYKFDSGYKKFEFLFLFLLVLSLSLFLPKLRGWWVGEGGYSN